MSPTPDRRDLRWLLVLGLLFLVGSSLAAHPLQLEFVKLVDSSTLVPGAQDPFLLDDKKPAVCDLGVVFIGLRETATELKSGIYAVPPEGGRIRTLVDEDSPVPGGQATFDHIDDMACDGSRIIFRALTRDLSTSQRLSGIYEWTTAGLRTVANPSTLAVGATVPLQSMNDPAVKDEAVSFVGRDTQDIEAIYLETSPGQLFKVFDTTRTIPTTVHMAENLDSPSLGSELLFSVQYRPDPPSGTVNGLLATDGQQLRVVSVYGDPLPGTPPSIFVRHGAPDNSGDQILFSAFTNLGMGLYLDELGDQTALVEPGSFLPDGQPVIFINQVSTDQGIHAFQHVPQLGDIFDTDLYLWHEGELTLALSDGDTLHGNRIAAYNFTLEDGVLALRAIHGDASQAIYAASLIDAAPPLDVPGPGGLGLGLLALLLAGSGTLWLRSS